MKNPSLEKVKQLARDLRQRAPRKPKEMLGGYALAARAVDKCRAVLVGWEGEYFSNCPLDQRWLSFAGIAYPEFRTFVATGATDQQVGVWIQEHATSHSPGDLAAWNDESGSIQVSD